MNDQKELYNAIMDNCYQEGIFDYKLACSYISNNLSSAFKVDKDAISRLER